MPNGSPRPTPCGVTHTDRFVAPAPTDLATLRRTEDLLLAALAEGFEALVLAPLLPSASHTAVATVDPRKVVATIRGSEVAADPANALALEAAERRSRALLADPRSSTPVRLAATQRVVRARHFDAAPGMLALFQRFALVTAGRDTGTRAFGQQHLVEHLRFAAEALSVAGVESAEIRLTGLNETSALLLEHTRAALTGTPGIDVREDADCTTGRGHYIDLCYKDPRHHRGRACGDRGRRIRRLDPTTRRQPQRTATDQRIRSGPAVVRTGSSPAEPSHTVRGGTSIRVAPRRTWRS